MRTFTGYVYCFLVAVLLMFALNRYIAVQRDLQEAMQTVAEVRSDALRLQDENQKLASAIEESAASSDQTD